MRNVSNGRLPQFYLFGEAYTWSIFGILDYLQLFVSFADFEVCGFL